MYTERLLQHSEVMETDADADAVLNMKDEELVNHARTGSREAFGELVRRHRERALGWASSITQDGQLAEDIVQEALISAFLRIETLMEPGRFRHWLQTIVRNQAMMKLRRGGPGGKESSFSALEARHSESYRSDIGSGLEHLLFRISARLDEERSLDQDPQTRLLRKDMYMGLYQLLRCLPAKERAIFEAHVFRELSPSEISEVLGVSPGSVYTSISRSRKKLQRERIRVYFQGFAQEKKQSGSCTRRVLAPPIPM
ncbi:sigma-70 family RNA polymerase sigma factor [Paenibacillus vini]|uniref:RNA polymerase sigma factor n=1 Tax=Paenibacillus vini TaxID=1476024 RepID=UPI0025B67164|nr:sigma-70 family RNA polymerase sigma factor [Paenibacillus vini]MDN4066754.1 sigma-70 family RNA polymerase sigma factor [Paenibacillus vini]